MIDVHELRLSYIIRDINHDWDMDLTDWIYQQLVGQRIRCDGLGYPESEAIFSSLQDWEDSNNEDFEEYLRNLLADAT